MLYTAGVVGIPYMLVIPSASVGILQGTRRSPEFVQDLYLSTTTRREVAFGICYWPTLATLACMGIWLTIIGGLLLAGHLLLPTGRQNRIGEAFAGFAAAIVAGSMYSLVITLRHWLQPGANSLKSRTHVFLELIRGTAGWLVATFSMTEVVTQVFEAIQVFDPDLSWKVTYAAMGSSFVLLMTLKSTALVRFAGRRFFADIETNDAKTLLWWASERIEPGEEEAAAQCKRQVNMRIGKIALPLMFALLATLAFWMGVAWLIELLSRADLYLPGSSFAEQYHRQRFDHHEGLEIGLYSIPFVSTALMFVMVTTVVLVVGRYPDRSLPLANGLLRYSIYGQFRVLAVVMAILAIMSILLGGSLSNSFNFGTEDVLASALYYLLAVVLPMYFAFVSLAMKRTRIRNAIAWYIIVAFMAVTFTCTLQTGWTRSVVIPSLSPLGNVILLLPLVFSGYLIMGGLNLATQRLFEEEVRHKPRFEI